jgi:hypothetical protein
MGINEEDARAIIELTKPAIETLNRVLLEVKPGDVTRAIYDNLRMRIGHALGGIFSLQYDLRRAFPNLQNTTNPTLNPSGKTANELVDELLPPAVPAPTNGMTREYGEFIQQFVLKAIRQTHEIFESHSEADDNIKFHVGRIIGRMQEVLEVVIAIYPDLDGLKDVEVPNDKS